MQPDPAPAPVDRTVLLAFGITALALVAGCLAGWVLVAVLR